MTHAHKLVFPYLSIEAVCEAALQLALNGLLPCQQRQVVGELVMRGNDGTDSMCVILWPTCPTKNLQYIQNPQVNEGARLGIVDLCTLLGETAHNDSRRN